MTYFFWLVKVTYDDNIIISKMPHKLGKFCTAMHCVAQLEAFQDARKSSIWCANTCSCIKQTSKLVFRSFDSKRTKRHAHDCRTTGIYISLSIVWNLHVLL